MLMVDQMDRHILRVLQDDGGLSTTQIAERVGLSQSPCWRRIARMEKEGIILNRSVMLDRRKLGFGTVVFVRVCVAPHGRQTVDEFATAAARLPEVQVVQLLLGEIDIRLRVVVRDLDHYNTLLRNHLVTLPGVQEIRSSVLLDEIKNTFALPI